MVDATTAQIITAAAALAAVIVGPATTLIVGFRQVRANTLSVYRQTWINALREDVAELMEKRMQWSQLFHPHSGGVAVVCTDEEKAGEIGERVRYLGYKVQLRLRAGEQQHDRLIALLQQAPLPPLNQELNTKIMDATREILNQEWEIAASAR